MRLFGMPGLLSCLLVIGANVGAAPASEGERFSLSSLETGMVGEQVVLYGQLEPGGSHHVIVGGTIPDGTRQLKVFRPGKRGYGPKAAVSVAVPGDVVLVDVGRLGDADVIVFFTRSRAILFDPVADSVRELVRFESIYNNPLPNVLPEMDFMRDLNGDGLDDIIVPGFEGYLVAVQRPGRVFAQPTMLAAPAIMEMTYEGHPWYQPRKLFHADFDLDGRKDLGFWRDDRLIYYSGIAEGFDSSGAELRVPLHFDFDGVESMSARMRDEDQSDLTTRVLYDLADLDGDGIPDLITLTVRSEGVFRKQTTHGIHLGRRLLSGALVFVDAPDAEVRSGGIQFEMEHRDLDADGRDDIVVSSVELGVGKIIGALLTGSIGIDLDFFRMHDRRYPSKPDASREVTASFNLASGDVFFPFVLLADIDGDGRSELLAQDGEKDLLVFDGEKGGRLFARQPERLTLDLPSDQDLVEAADLNLDGRSDIIMRLEARDRAASVQILIANPD